MDEEIKKVIDIVKQVKPSLQDMDETTVLNRGELDSLDIMTVVTLLEKEFEVKIEGICLKQENFKTAATLMDMIQTIKR